MKRNKCIIRERIIMGDREKTQIKLFQTKGVDSIEKMNNYLITNGINRRQVIKIEIGYIQNAMNELETVITLVYNDEWKK